MIRQTNMPDTEYYDNIPSCGITQGGIVLLAKRPGSTSFSSLFTIKHALHTSKVGHTGTLDSFASGLLVVCAGPLTRLASRITEFDKKYDAVIEFGTETDTLEWTGRNVKAAPLPDKAAVLSTIAKYTGKSMQVPPLFSALHLNGERASDIARSGRKAEIPARPVTVFHASAEEFRLAAGEKVEAVRVQFTVSKGTYIRSLARDIGEACGSAAHLAGLRRIAVGSFKLEDAAGAALLEPFTIETVYKAIAAEKKLAAENSGKNAEHHVTYVPGETELALQQEVRMKLRYMTEDLAGECGFGVLHLVKGKEKEFSNGKTLGNSFFTERATEGAGQAAVFSQNGRFAGMILRQPDGKFSYLFVIPVDFF
jgi:tRNA pseudouridine55 synthase